MTATADNPFRKSTYAAALRHLAARYGSREALVFRDRRYSFSDVLQEANAASARFAALGLTRGDKVAILLPNRPEFLFAWLGAAQMGLVAVMVNTRLRRDELAYQLAQSDSRAVIVPGAGAFRDFLAEIAELTPALLDGSSGRLASAALPELGWVVAVDPPARPYRGLTEWAALPADGPLPPLENDPEQPGIIAYSSGTTALPKGAMVTHCVWRKAWDIGERIDLTKDDCFYLSIPLFGSMATMNGILQFWVRGAKAVLGEQFDAGHCLRAVEQERVTAMHLLPPIIRQIVDHPDFAKRDRSSWRIAFTLSVDPKVLDTVADVIGVPGVMTGYGMTETTTVVTRNRWDDPREIRHGTQGRVLPDIEVKVVDPESLEDLPCGQAGEIWVRGYCVMLGYYKKPQETARCLRPDGWLRTGDLGILDESGRLKFKDRLDDSYKSRGFNVSPAEIEQVLLRWPAVAQTAVVGVPDPELGAKGVAFVIPREGEEVDTGALHDFLRTHLASYKVPTDVFTTAAFPLTSGTGKVQKFKLRKEAMVRLGLATPEAAQ